MKKRVLALVLALFVTVSLFSGCSSKSESSQNSTQDTAEKVSDSINMSGFPILKEKTKVTIMMPITTTNKTKLTDNLWYKRMEEKTNIQIDITEVPAANYLDKRNLSLVSGDYPDIFYHTGGANAFTLAEELRYGKDGIFIPLEKLVDTYAPTLKKMMADTPLVKKSITQNDGHIYALPYLAKTSETKVGQPFTEAPFFNINKSWLKTLNLKEPTTVEELYTVLKAFKESDPNQNGKADEIPIISAGAVGAAGSNSTGIRESLSWFGSMWGLYADSNKIYFGQATDQYKDYLKFFRKLYSEKIYYNDSITMNVDQVNALGQGDVQLLGSFYAYGTFQVVGEKNYVNYGAIPAIKAANGKQWVRGRDGITTGVFVITKNCKVPEAMVRWIDYQYTEEGATLAWLGEKDKEYSLDSNGVNSRLIPNGMTATDFTDTFTGPYILVPDVWNKTNDPMSKDLFANRYGVLNKYAVPPLPKLLLDPDQSKKNATITTDINKYVEEFMVKAITGEIDVDKGWNNYISTLKNMGLDELINSNQKALDEYNNK